MSASLTIRIEPDDFDLDSIFAQVESLAEEEEWAADLTFRVNLALEELTLNTMTHGRHDELEAIEIMLDSKEDQLTIVITDNGLPFNPTEDAPEPEVGQLLSERSVGGLGVYLVHTLMDEMQYKRAAGRNCLTLIARRVE